MYLICPYSVLKIFHSEILIYLIAGQRQRRGATRVKLQERRCSYYATFPSLIACRADSLRGFHGNPRKNLSILPLVSLKENSFKDPPVLFRSSPIASFLLFSKLTLSPYLSFSLSFRSHPPFSLSFHPQTPLEKREPLKRFISLIRPDRAVLIETIKNLPHPQDGGCLVTLNTFVPNTWTEFQLSTDQLSMNLLLTILILSLGLIYTTKRTLFVGNYLIMEATI